MAREIKISAGTLNVRLHPHSPEIYKSWIRDVFNLRKPVTIRGDRKAVISILDHSRSDEGLIRGTITTFTEIETDGTWFDIGGMQEATSNQISEIHIPSNLRPNSASFYFYFNVITHKLYIQEYSKGKIFTLKSAARFFCDLANNVHIVEKYNAAKITLIQSKEALEKIFQLDVLKKLIIVVQRPNPDIFSSNFTANINRHLEQAKSRQVTIQYDAEAGQSINVTGDIREVGEYALDHGSVVGAGRESGRTVTRSTEDHPQVLQASYDPDLQSEDNAFVSLIKPADRI